MSAFDSWLQCMQHAPEPSALLTQWCGLDAVALERLLWRVRAIRARVTLSQLGRPLPVRPAARLAVQEMNDAGLKIPGTALPDLVNWLSESADGPQCLLLTPDVRDAVIHMYREVVMVFRHRFAPLCPRPHRGGLPGAALPSHWYTLYKLLQLLGRDADILKDKGLCIAGPTVERYDQLWQAVCADLGWPYLPSVYQDVAMNRAEVVAPYELLEPHRCGPAAAAAAAGHLAPCCGWWKYRRVILDNSQAQQQQQLGSGGWQVQYLYVRSADTSGSRAAALVDGVALAAMPKLLSAIQHNSAMTRLILWPQGHPGAPYRVGDAWSVDDLVTFHLLQHRGALYMCATVCM